MTITGVSWRHATAMAQVAKEMNCFIFIRPSTADTVRLIEAGFATKSNDVHDKSSDWGPMAGFVPVDQGLNKKSRAPTWDSAKVAAHRHDSHGTEKPVHLVIDDRLAIAQPMTNTTSSEPGLAGYRLYVDRTRNPDLIFARSARGEVYWWDARNKALVPLMVWGYGGVPITGDYDLWMVAPHISNKQKYGLEALVNIYGTVDEHKTASAATPFLLRLNNRLNTACRTAIPGSRQVFNHGAEAQNYGFTQALDKEMALITPGGRAYNIARPQFAAALDEMERRGYMVIHNKRWLSRNALMSGEKFTDGRALWRAAITGVRRPGTQKGARFEATVARTVAQNQLRQKQKSQMVGGNRVWANADDEKGYFDRLSDRKVLRDFGQQLRTLRTDGIDGDDRLRVLSPADFPADCREPLSVEELWALQDTATRASRNTVGAGQNQHTGGLLNITGTESAADPFAVGFGRPRYVPKRH